ncbi:MAG: DJ-1/PfpI family protein [Acidimicrobiales bacterium]
MPSIGIALFDGVEELDWVGPWEVFAAWAKHFPGDGARVWTMARAEGVVTCAKGVQVLAQHSWSDHPELDVLLVPGGQGTRPLLGDEEIRATVQAWAGQAQIVTSVCTGALVLADAGLLDGRPATTHWAAFDEMAKVGPTVELRRHERFVDTGAVVTSAGVSAGIDMALHLVGRLSPVGMTRAQEVQKVIEYYPQPPGPADA